MSRSLKPAFNQGIRLKNGGTVSFLCHKEKKERLRNAEFRAREFFKESLRLSSCFIYRSSWPCLAVARKWKWSPDLKGPLRIPQSDDLAGFRVKAPF